MKLNGKTLINSVLFVCLLSIAYSRFHREDLIINTASGSRPERLLEVLKRNKLHTEKQFRALFIFGERPALSSLEDIDKLYHVHNTGSVEFCVISQRRFRRGASFGVRISYLPQYRFSYKDAFGTALDKACFIFMKEGRILFADKIPAFGQIDQVLSLMRPQKEAQSVMSAEDLKTALIDRLKNKPINLLNIRNRETVSLRSAISPETEQVVLVDAECMSCELDKALGGIMEMKHRNVIVILSVSSNSYEIKAFLDTRKSDVRVFVDYFDGLELLHTDGGSKITVMSFMRKEYEW